MLPNVHAREAPCIATPDAVPPIGGLAVTSQSHNRATREDLRQLLNHSNEQSTKAYIHETPKRLTEIAKSFGRNHLRLVAEERT